MKSFLNTLTLKTRIITSVVLLTIAGIGGLASHVTEVLHSDVEKQLSEQLSTTVNYVAADIDGRMSLRMATLEEVAASISPEALAEPGKIQLLLDQRRLSAVLFPVGGGVVNSHGKVVAEFGMNIPGRKGGVIKDPGDYAKAMAGCKTLVLPPRIGRFARQPVVAFAAPICSRTGDIAGAIFGAVPLSDHDLFGQLEQAGTVTGNRLFVLSRSTHAIVAANDKSRILEAVNDESPLIKRRFDDGFEGMGTTVNRRGVEVLSVSRNMTKTDWFVLAAAPTKTAFGPIADLKTHIVMAALAIALATSVILFFLLRKLLSPLEAAEIAMQRMTDGSAPLASLPIRRNDEIGRLIANFNKLVVERKAAQEEIEFIAHHDVLTGFPNRREVQSRFAHIVSYAESHAAGVALAVLNIDNFKAVNDSMGRDAGDEMLQIFAIRLRKCIDAADIVGRAGGDEFLIVLGNISDANEIDGVLAKILAHFAYPVTINGRELLMSASIGVSVFPKDGNQFEGLYKKADTAMLQAKESGRNTYRYFDSLLNVDVVERLELRNSMQRALDRSEFVLHYQPQINLHTGEVIGAEALIRWDHPEQGLIMPSRFISIAEDSGLIVRIGEWVLREACRQAVAWQKAGLPQLVMAVNLSAVQFKRGDLEETLAAAIADSGIDPQFLELELTESILIKDTENVLQRVRRLKSLGVKLSIDDFGTGYSSLAYLKKFAVDKIKIDQSFVRDLATNPEDTAIVRAIIQMARSLNLQIIAEGVEDERTADHLRMHRCDEAQGYCFAKPMPADAFFEYLSTVKARPAYAPVAEHSAVLSRYLKEHPRLRDIWK